MLRTKQTYIEELWTDVGLQKRKFRTTYSFGTLRHKKSSEGSTLIRRISSEVKTGVQNFAGALGLLDFNCQEHCEILSQPVHGTATYRCDDTRSCIIEF